MAGLQPVSNIGQPYALVCEQDDHVIKEVGGFVDGLVPITRLRRKCEFHAFLADFLRDSFRTRGNEFGRIALLTWALNARPDNRFEFGNKCYVVVGHRLSPRSDIDPIFGQVLFEICDRQFRAMENTGRQCTVNVGVFEDVEKVAS